MLTKDSTDFEDGYYEVKNLRPGDDGLEIIRNGEAEVTLEVSTPYIIVPKVNDLDDPDDDEDASVVTVKAQTPVHVLVSPDHGLSWKEVADVQPASSKSIDLTSIVKGTYGYHLKFKTSGFSGSTAINSLSIKTWVQVAPASLPVLMQGKTTFQYYTGDRYGQRTIPMLINPNTADPEGLKRYVMEMPVDYDPNRHTCRIRGNVILRLAAPPGTKISWFTVGGTFRTHQGEQARKTDNRIAYAVDHPKGFRDIYNSQVPAWVNHWRYNWDEDVILSDPTDTVYIKYTANTGLNTIRACLHLLPNSAPSDNLRVTYTYRVGGQLRSTEKRLQGPTTYTIECPSEPENVSITLAVPHGEK
ncbi:MAG: hypothetical protein ACYTFQ_31990 [Planctomycetota bacterium]|jgi:hypothetical protein